MDCESWYTLELYQYVSEQTCTDQGCDPGLALANFGLGAGFAWGGRKASKRPTYESCDGNSFTPDTQVVMADGTTKPISQVRIGDEVLATDPETGETAAKLVEATLIHVDRQLVDVTLDGRLLGKVVKTTADHRFWSETRHDWVRAGQLVSGERLSTPSDNSVVVRSVALRIVARLMWNLTVDDVHTYYVLAGDTPVLVHNDGVTPPAIVQAGIDAYNRGELTQRKTTKKMENGKPVRVNGRTVQIDDFYEGRSGPIGAREFWRGAAIYEIPGGGNDYRLLVKSDGKIGWVGPKGGRAGAGHNYDRITTYQPCG